MTWVVVAVGVLVYLALVAAVAAVIAASKGDPWRGDLR